MSARVLRALKTALPFALLLLVAVFAAGSVSGGLVADTTADGAAAQDAGDNVSSANTQYELTVDTLSDGRVLVSPPNSAPTQTDGATLRYPAGTELTLGAVPQSGKVLDQWQGDVPSDLTEQVVITINLNSDRDISAVFENFGAPDTVVYDFDQDQVTINNNVEISNNISARSSVGNSYSSGIVGVPRGDDISTSQVPNVGRDNRERVTEPEEDNVNSSIVSIGPQSVNYCSGVMISESHVLTAAHCVYNVSTGQWIDDTLASNGFSEDDVNVYPAQSDRRTHPYGTADIETARMYSTYYNSGSGRHDMALLTLDKPLGEHTGTIEYDSYQTVNPPYNARITGYPGNKPDGTMWTHSGEGRLGWSRIGGECPARIIINNPLCSNEFLTYSVDTSSGQSGSPVLVEGENRMIGIHTFLGGGSVSSVLVDTFSPLGAALPSGETYNRGVSLSQEDITQIDAWIAADQPRPDRPEIVRESTRWGVQSYSPAVTASSDVTAAVDEIEIEHTIRNIGTDSVSSVDIGYYLQDDTTACSDTPSSRDQVAVQSVSAPAPFESTDVTWSGELPAGVTDGERRLCMEIDPNNDVTEFNQYPDYNTERLGELTVRSPNQFNLDIVGVDGQAGAAGAPSPVNATIDLTYDGDVFSANLDESDFDITVGGRTVTNPITIDDNPDGTGTYELEFSPPTQPDAGVYDLDISFRGVASDSRDDSIRYGEGGTQIAANLQIDASGSMSGSKLDSAKNAAETFVQQMSSTDYLSVVSYAGNARVDRGMNTIANERQSIITDIQSVDTRGSTNIGDSLNTGFSTFTSAPPRTSDAAVLLTDGNIRTGPSEDNILNNIVPKYNNRGICLYTVGFGSDADGSFLQQIADRADCGEYQFAGTDDEDIDATIQAVFADIQSDIERGETLQNVEGTVDAGQTRRGNFQVDDSVRDSTASFQVETSPDDVTLERPDGTTANPSDPGVSVAFVGNAAVYRLDDPQPGQWTYVIENTQQSAIDFTGEVTGGAQTTLELTQAGETYYVGDEVDITARVTGTNGGVDNAFVQATVTTPSGGTTTTVLGQQSPGLYTGTVDATQSGQYSANVTVQRGDLSRTETILWSVSSTEPFSVDASDTSVVQGTTGTFDISIGGGSGENAVVAISDIEEVVGSGTISNYNVDFDSQTIRTDGASVTATVPVPDNTPAGDYEATVRAFTDDGEVVQESVTVTVLEPPTFEFQFIDIDSPVEETEAVDLLATITNTGDIAGQQTVSFDIPGLGLSETTVSLASSESTTETLSISTGPGDARTYSATASTSNETRGTSVDVLGPAYFAVSVSPSTADGLPVGVPPGGGETTVSATITNTGDERDSQLIEFRTAGNLNSIRQIQLAPGESRQVEFSSQTDIQDVRDVASISSANATAGVPLTDISQLATFEVNTITPADTTVPIGNSVDISAEIEHTDGIELEQPVELNVGDISRSQDVKLSPGDTTAVTFTDVDTGQLSIGDYTPTVTTPDLSQRSSLTVRERRPADFQVRGVATDDLIVPEGNTIDIPVQIENVGEKSGPQQIELSVGNALNIQQLSVPAGENVTTQFENVGTDTLDRGEYTVRISTANSTFYTSLTVGLPPVVNNPPQDLDGDGLNEDINGDGRVNVLDVQILFDNLNNPVVQNNQAAFKFVSSGNRVNVLDVQALFDAYVR